MKFASVSSQVLFFLCLVYQADISLGQEEFDIQTCLQECGNRCDSVCQDVCKASCFQKSKPQAQKEEVEEASVDVYSRDFRPEREVNFRSQRRSLGETIVDEDDCGLLCDTKRINQCGLETCLRDAFSKTQTEVFFPCSEGWDKARSTALAGYKQPRAVMYAEDTTDVQTAVKCAFDNGIKVTARGRGHSFQGWGVVDGYLVVDMSKMCRPKEFDFDKEAQGPHILPGSRYIATVKAGPGCTNAVMLHSVWKEFKPEEGAMALIGFCPSVGITGFTLGGGMGDITPYVGYAADLVEEMEVVLYDGSHITASKDDHPDLFWALRGGGGGMGIVTSLTLRIVKAPQKGSSPRFTRFALTFDDEKEAYFRMQAYMYDSKSSVKFGGTIIAERKTLYGSYLGSREEAMDDMRGAGLLDPAILTADPNLRSVLWTNYKQICGGKEANCLNANGDGIPSLGVEVREYLSYGEMEGRVICEYTELAPTTLNRTADICEDLGLGEEYCVPGEPPAQRPGATNWVELDCDSEKVLKKFLEESGDPTAFMNNFGRPGIFVSLGLFGFLLPKLEEETIKKLGTRSADHTPIDINHLSHGAPIHVSPDATAFPWRDAGILTGAVTEDHANIILQDKRFQKDINKLQGYYNYMVPSIPNWRRFYFDQNWERLVEIKGRYDPLDVFGKDVTAEIPIQPPREKNGFLQRLKRLFCFWAIKKGRNEL